MKVFGTDTEYFVGERSEMSLAEANAMASTADEDQDEDPETTQEEIDAIYASVGLDPNIWDEE